MEELEHARQKTEQLRQQTASGAQAKKTAMELRLLKIRQRKRAKLGLPALDEDSAKAQIAERAALESRQAAELEAEQAERAEKLRLEALQAAIQRKLVNASQVRPWDLGKDGVPEHAKVATQESWTEKKRAERNPEFAPPTTDRSQAPRRAKAPAEPPTLSEESIVRGLAFFKYSAQQPRGPPEESPGPPEDDDVEDSSDPETIAGVDPDAQESTPGPDVSNKKWKPKPSGS